MGYRAGISNEMCITVFDDDDDDDDDENQIIKYVIVSCMPKTALQITTKISEVNSANLAN